MLCPLTKICWASITASVYGYKAEIFQWIYSVHKHDATKAKFGDIAKEAGISRPTLYAAFEDKNAIMIATIHHISEQLLETIRGQIADKVTAEDRLSLYAKIAIIEPYKLIQKSEDAADILSGHNDDELQNCLTVLSGWLLGHFKR